MSRPQAGDPPGGGAGSERSWLRRFEIRPNKTLGQNFLINPRVRDRLVDGWRLTRRDAVLEIGAGAGALTIPLLKRAGHVWAVEKDGRLCDLLETRAHEAGSGDRLTLVRGDVLHVDPEVLPGLRRRKLVVVGNLPYAVTSPVVLWILRNRKRFRHASIMVQREYGRRLLAAPGSAGCGSLTIWVAYHARVSLEMKVGRGAFWPMPKVDSVVVRVDFRSEPPYELADPSWLEASLRRCFGQRRKQLGGVLVASMGWERRRVQALLDELGIAPSRRGETLSLEEHCRLAERLAESGGDPGD